VIEMQAYEAMDNDLIQCAVGMGSKTGGVFLVGVCDIIYCKAPKARQYPLEPINLLS